MGVFFLLAFGCISCLRGVMVCPGNSGGRSLEGVSIAGHAGKNIRTPIYIYFLLIKGKQRRNKLSFPSISCCQIKCRMLS